MLLYPDLESVKNYKIKKTGFFLLTSSKSPIKKDPRIQLR